MQQRCLHRSLKREPLGHETVQRRQRRNRQCADQKIKRGVRQVADQPAHLVQISQPGRLQNRAGAEKEQALEYRVIERVIQPRDQSQRRGDRVSAAEKNHREPDADQDNADVLDRMVREQALQIVLHQREQHAEQRSRRAEQKHGQAPLPADAADEIVDHAHHAINCRLQHHTA